MKDYEPLDLSTVYNVGVELFEDGDPPPTGLQSFHGIPFLMGGGEGDSQAVIALNDRTTSVVIPVGSTAHRLLFAHRLTEWDSTRPEHAGQEVAEYRVNYADGQTETAFVRERFEIASVGLSQLTRLGSVGSPSLPFLAVPDGKHTLRPRHEGAWGEMGLRQMESIGARARWNYLWAWTNPQRDVVIDSIELVLKGPSFIVSAVTLGHIDEEPFARQGRRPMHVTLEGTAEGENSLEIDVNVDRGVTTYPFMLPASTTDEFLNDPLKGWGEAENQKGNPAYVEISAVPSATVTVNQGEAIIGEVNWGKVQSHGTVESGRM